MVTRFPAESYNIIAGSPEHETPSIVPFNEDGQLLTVISIPGQALIPQLLPAGANDVPERTGADASAENAGHRP